MKFTAELKLNGKTATGIRVPDDVVDQLGGKRIPVVVTLGDHTYRTTIAPMGGAFWVPVSAEQRAAASVAAGEILEVEVSRDESPRTVETPADLAEKLASDPQAREFFEGLAHSHKKEYVRWIEEAKKPETRQARVEKCLALLQEKRRTR